MLALDGITILDLSGGYPPAFGTQILGDLGAEVINIEGRPARTEPPAGVTDEEVRRAAAYRTSNRNKKSIGLNLKSEAGRHVFYQLAETADVIVDPFRPGVTKRLGIDYPTINKINPRIIYCSITGYGQDGPYRDLPGHDINYISIAGALSLIGEAGSQPVIPLNLLADFGGAALHATIGILAALMARVQTGKGQYLDISYTDSVISLLTFIASSYFQSNVVPQRGELRLGGSYPYYTIYRTKDGKFITIGCSEPWLWANLCRAIGKEEFIPFHLEPEHDFHPPEDEKWQEISTYLKQHFLTKTRDEWFEFLSKKDVPIGKVHSLDEVFADPQVLHRQMVIEVEHPTVGKIKQVGMAIKLSDTPGKVRSLPPVFGEHTNEILIGLGYSEQRINELRQEEAVS